MATFNKHGLSRSSLNESTKRQIRQNSGFGCVVCGLAIGDYEHVDPDFADAIEHNPENMTFLCAQHHALVTRGRLSKETVKEHMKNPAAQQASFSHESFYLGNERPIIVLGNITAIRAEVILKHEDIPIFWVDEPEVPGGPFRINAEFRNRLGQVIFSIRNNEWRARTDNWDVESEGPRTYIRNSKGDIALIIRTEPPNKLVIERLDLQINGFSFICDGSQFYIESPNGHHVSASGGKFVGCKGVIHYKNGAILLGEWVEHMELTDVSVALNQPMSKSVNFLLNNNAPKVRGALWDKVQKLRR